MAKKTFKFDTVDEMLALPDPGWLIEGFIKEGTVSLLVGAPGSHKSYIARDQAISLAEGTPWAGIATTQRPVISILGERARFQAARLRPHFAEHSTKIPLWHLREPVLFDDSATAKHSSKAFRNWACKTVSSSWMFYEPRLRAMRTAVKTWETS